MKRGGALKRYTPLRKVSLTNSRPPAHSGYVAWIRSLPCAVCAGARGKSEAAHTKVLGRGSRRRMIRSIIPLCVWDHTAADDSYHAIQPESRWADLHAIDLPELVHRLNSCYDLTRAGKARQAIDVISDLPGGDLCF
jgi:hypothetical protein